MFGSIVRVSFLITTLLNGIVAFNPTFSFTAFGFLGKAHSEITKDAINSRYQPYFGITTPSKSMKYARTEIEDGAAIVDEHGERLNEAENPTCHFDDEQFEASNYRLIAKKVDIVNLLEIDEVSLAREMLGRALHTLQDFYSHSNWVDMGLSDISQNLGVKWPLEYYPVDPDLPTCKQCRYENGDPALARADIDGCRYLGADAGTGLPNPMSSRTKSLVYLCLKTLNDNTIPNCKEPSNLMVFPDLVNNPPHILTSGYFGTEPKLHSHKKPYKCSHGGPFDRDADGLEGISKDTKSPFWSPHWWLHDQAAVLAQNATVKYLDELKEMICRDGSGAAIATSKCVNLKKLYGIGPTLAFVIDTTGSMGGVIASVRSIAISIVNYRRGSVNAPGLYVLSQIQDPAPASASLYSDPDSFIAAISKLGASGGGDCPEYAMTGVKNALALTFGGTLHLWTDASAKDPILADSIAMYASKQQVSIYSYLFGDCGTGSVAAFKTISSGTKGQYFSGLSSVDASITAKLAELLTLEDKVDLWYIDFNPTLSRRQAAPRSLAFDLLVDSSLKNLTFSLSGTSLTLTLVRPDGATVLGSDRETTFYNLATGVIYSISDPQPGAWKMTVSGNSEFSLSVFGTSSLQFDTFRKVEPSGGTHEGYFPVALTPAPGSQVISYGILDGPFSTADFELRTLEGQSLGKIDLKPGSGASDADIPANLFFGNITIPNGAFNVYVTGKDSSGARYQRVLPGILTPVTSNSSMISNSTGFANATTTSKGLWSDTTSEATATGTRWTNSASNVTATRTDIHTTCPACQPTPRETALATLTQ